MENRKKEIFSRNMNQRIANSSRPKDINDSYLDVLNQIEGQGLNKTVFGELSFKSKRGSVFNDTFDRNVYMNNSQRSQTMHRSNRLSQPKFDMNGSDCSFESSRLKKSPYNNHTHLSALKSHYHHNLSQNRSQDLEIHEQIRQYNQSHQQQISNQIHTRNFSLDNKNKTELSLFRNKKKQSQEIHNYQQNLKHNIQLQQPLNTCNIDSKAIPDYNERLIALKLKRASLLGQNGTNNEISQPIFITTTRKGLGLQIECAKTQMINYKSSMGQHVLKISMDDPLKLKHRIWIEESGNFMKELHQKRGNNKNSNSNSLGHQSIENTEDDIFNLENLVQNQHQLVAHEWTPKSSILMEFQDLQHHHAYQNIESNQYSHQTSQNQHPLQSNSQNQSQIYIQNQLQKQKSLNDRTNKVIYSFKKDRNLLSKMRRASSNQTQSDPDQVFKKLESRENSKLQMRGSFNENIEKQKGQGSKKKRVSGEFTSKASMSQLKKIDLIFDKESQQNNSSIVHSLDQNMKMSKEVYPQSMSLQKSFEKAKDSKTPSLPIQRNSLSIHDSRENIEDAKDINVTQISIKVSLDQKKPTQHTSIEKTNPKIFSLKSLDNNNNNDGFNNGISTEALLMVKASGKNIAHTKRSLKRPPIIYDKNTELIKSDENRPRTQDDNYQLNQYASKYKKQAQLLVLKTTELKIDHEQSQKIIIRAKSANTNNRNFRRIQLISPSNKNNFKNKLLTAQSRYNQNIAIQNYSSVNNSQNDNQRNTDEQMFSSVMGPDKSFRDNKFLIEDHEQINQFNRTFVHNRKDSKSIVSKYQGRNLENSSIGDIVGIGLEKKKSQTQIIQSSHRNRSQRNIIRSPDKNTIKNDQIQNLTIQNEKNSIPTNENDCESSIVKKSYIDSTLEIDPNQQFNQPQIIDKMFSGGVTSQDVSHQQSRTQFRATFDYYKTQISFQGKNFSTNSAGNLRNLNTQYSNQDPSTKRTVLMKHIRRTPNGYGPGGINQASMNIQTGEGGQRHNNLFSSNSIVQVQMLPQEELTTKDLNLNDMLDPLKNIRQLKQTDLPRHSRANPSLIKKNLELVMKMKKAEKIMKNSASRSIYNPNQTMNGDIYKENNINAFNVQTNNHFTRNSNNISFLSMKPHEYQNSFDNELIINSRNQRVKSQMGKTRDRIAVKNEHINVDSLDGVLLHQKVKIPHPLILQSYQSQLSTIKQPSKQNNNNNSRMQNNINQEETIALDTTQNLNATLLSVMNESQLPQIVDQFITEKKQSNEHNQKPQSSLKPQVNVQLEQNNSIGSFLNQEISHTKSDNYKKRMLQDNTRKRSNDLIQTNNTSKVPNSKLVQDRQKLKNSKQQSKARQSDIKSNSKLLEFSVYGTNVEKRKDSQASNLQTSMH
ncbi:UNKNOWN [Stylonychia lemnae]|uniref:Uncharacterized protein n=1 Tax=Stylonychia lemnae TaxID=5949 RepID=A0A078A9L1_STYLE|nr:UNKNOWN [Stylonychia lemnae]|eukprot:CDW78277.1 UNKNOWN [Stylonychia lemnae]